MLRQAQQQKLIQKLSPQQIQLMKLLQVPTASLEERIKEELESNPALDDGNEEEQEDPYNFEEDTVNEPEVGEAEEKDELEEYLKMDITDYLRSEHEERGDYHVSEDNDDDEPATTPVRVETTFHDYLKTQLGMLNLNTYQTKIAQQIIGSIDDDGYLRRDPVSIVDDLAFNYNIITSVEEVLSLLKNIQDFDPSGVGARDLQECLLLQLHKLEQSQDVKNAENIIGDYFDEFTRKHYDKIKLRLKLDEDTFKHAIGTILKLTPKPGGAFSSSSKTANYIIPDFFIFNNNGELELTLNARNAPELRISEGYKEMLKSYDSGGSRSKKQKEALLFIKQKIDSAKWFIDAIKQRQHTLLLTMNAIMEYQKQFFLSGNETELRPMILKDIAEKIDMDISTISRVANSKYVQTEYGTFILKYFFSEGLVTDSGEEVSTREVKSLLQDLIASEHKKKPYSDEKLMKLLSEKGYTVARRTVAKYREQLDIPVARLRKEA
jgi:RNA polymerase sigma-54 factor